MAKFLFLCGYIELNPGDTFDFSVWNCNSLIAHNFTRVSLIETYNSIHRLKLIGLTETGLKSDIENSNLELPGYSIIRSDLPTSHSHGGVLLYYKNDLAVKHRTDLQLHSNTIAIQIEISKKKVIFFLVYRKFGQTLQDFDNFHEKIDQMLKNAKKENPHCIILSGDLNAHLKEWYGNKDDHFGLTFQRIFNKHGISQLIHEPTYITNKSKTCIDVLSTDQPNLVAKKEVHPSLHTNCHHQVIHAKINIKCPPPPTHKRHIWHYSRAKIDSMQKASYDYFWDQNLSNLHPDEQVDHFNEVIINISKNFIPNELKTFNPKEPPWITKSCKSLYLKYKRKYKNFERRNFPPQEKGKIDELKEEYTKMVEIEKEKYLKSLGNLLSDPSTGSKKYWTILKKFLKKNVCAVIPPLLHCEKFIVDAVGKCKIFNEFFEKHCKTIPTSSTLPELIKTTNLSLKNVNFTESDILKHLRKLNSKKAHGHDLIPVRILKMFDKSITKPLFMIYKNCLKHNYFPDQWKMANIVPVHKKNEQNLVKNYRPISLLPISGKIFEKLIFDNLYDYVFKNDFISDKQSGYRKGDSTVKQLLSITHEIHKAFDKKQELRAVFLDISKAFDTVWHEGLLFKLERIGIEGEMLNIIKSFLLNRKQRVTIDGKYSEWANVQAGVPQGSILGPILFLIFINDLTEVVESDIRIFADDTFIFRIVDQFSSEILNRDLNKITAWAWQWKLVFNPDISKQAVEIVFSTKKIKSILVPLIFNNIPVKKVEETKHLGMILDSELNFESHISEKLAKARKGLGVMKQLKKWVDMQTLENIYKLYVRPHLDYGDIVFDTADLTQTEIFSFKNTNDKISIEIETIQYQAARIVTGAWKGSSTMKLYNILGWESMKNRRVMRKLSLIFETLKDKSPRYLYKIFEDQKCTNELRSTDRLMLRNIITKKIKFEKSFFPSGISYWNKLNVDIKVSATRIIFKNKILNKIRPKKASYYGLRDNDMVRQITLLRVELSPLNAHKYKYNFSDTPNPCCHVCKTTEDSTHFLLLCKSFRLSRSALMHNISSILGFEISSLPRRNIVQIFLYGKEGIDNSKNRRILEEVSNFIDQSKRFDKTQFFTTPSVPREGGGV